jgi:UDP-N-acetylmuramoyl-tripeptide--D-alanyl-D-alanine ligase
MVTTAREIAHHAHGAVVAGLPDAVVTSWSVDSRSLEPGACFVARPGERDGHEFVRAAFAGGARVALVSEALGIAPPVGGAVVRVDNVRLRLQDLARAARAAHDWRVVGITGSTGKTSTKDLLAATLAPLGCHASPASYNNEFGLPITLLNAGVDTQVVVAEMGERFPGDVAALCAIARPDAGIVTNVGLAHAEHLGDLNGAAKVMSELFEALPPGAVAVCNADDDCTGRLTAAGGVDIVTAGTAAGADYRIEQVEIDDHLRPSFSLRGHRFTVPLHGEHQAVNAALALAVAHRVFGIELAAAAEALAAARPARWRLELHTTPAGVTLLNDTYNANPSSMDAALRALAHTPTEGRRIAVLGDMRDLGVHGDDAHTAVGVRAGELRLDALVGVGAGGRAIATAAAATVPDVRTAPDAVTALDVVRAMAEPGDTILLKASRAVGLELVATDLLEGAS